MCQQSAPRTRAMAGHTFAGLENEWDAFPPGVVNPERGGGKSGADRVRRDGVVVEVTWLAIGRDILAKERIVPLDWGDRAKDLHLEVGRGQ